MKIQRTHLVIALTVAILVTGLVVGASRTLKSQVDTQTAYVQMYEDLATKSPDHRNLVDYYRSCVENTHTNRLLRSVATMTCLDKTQEWSKKLTLKVPYLAIEKEIRAGEAQVHLSMTAR
jgi:hypothetical protein